MPELVTLFHCGLGMLTGATQAARLTVEECFKWANQRKVFGKRLIDQPVIRHKLAKMVSTKYAVHERSIRS